MGSTNKRTVSSKGSFTPEIRTNRIQGYSKQIFGFFILFSLVFSSFLIALGKAAPVIVDEDSEGYWEDNFEDVTGIESWENLTLNQGEVVLSHSILFSDDFTGSDGDPPNSTKWDTLDDGYTLEITDNQLNSTVNESLIVWLDEMVQTNSSFSVNHTLTWRQKLHTNPPGGMYYHFIVLNGTDDSILIGVHQNDNNDYILINFLNLTEILIDTYVSDWHDYKMIFNDGNLIFYFDDVIICDWAFNATSVKYQFGSHCLNGLSTIYTDDIEIISLGTEGQLTSTEITLPTDKTWDSLVINKTENVPDNEITVSILDGITFLPIPGFENLTGTDIDISGIDEAVYPTIRLRAYFSGDGLTSPILSNWMVSWADTIPPSIPSGFNVDDLLTGNSLLLTWDAVPEIDVDFYLIYYSQDNSSFSLLYNVSANKQVYVHHNLTKGETYYYKIASADEVPNQSPLSEVVQGIPDTDLDGDGIGDLTDPDIDGDSYLNEDDAFPYDSYEWLDSDEDGIGDNSDPDDDNDGFVDYMDAFPLDETEWLDTDNDTIGNNADDDDDGDGHLDIDDAFPLDDTEWSDLDGDGIGDNTDEDIDGDGYDNDIDEFIYDPNEWQDFDSDEIGDNADLDDDNDGHLDTIDAFPHNSAEWLDTDNDSIGNNADDDDDNDGHLDIDDAFPLDKLEWLDTDGDGTGDEADMDDDDDGYTDIFEIQKGSDPLVNTSVPTIKSSHQKMVLSIEQISLGLFIGTIIGFVFWGVLFASEIFKFALISLFLPLFVRRKKQKIEENEVRGMIRAYVKLHPGVHYSALKLNLGLPNGSLVYHLRKLEKQDIIYSKKDGRYKRFYPQGAKPDKKPILTDIQDDMLETIDETPGVSKAEIAYIFDRNRQDINHNVNVLIDKDLVYMEKERGRTHLYVNEGKMDRDETKGYNMIVKEHEDTIKDKNELLGIKDWKDSDIEDGPSPKNIEKRDKPLPPPPKSFKKDAPAGVPKNKSSE